MGEIPLQELINSAVLDLKNNRWESFIENVNVFNSQIPYQLLANQRTGIEAYFHFAMYLMFRFRRSPCKYTLSIEEPTNKGRADLVLSSEEGTIIFEPNMENNRENPVYECKEKYIRKYLVRVKEEVICVGLKFTPKGIVASWGAAAFSRDKGLIKEFGNISLVTQFQPEEEEKISHQLTDFQKDSELILQSGKLIEFLKNVGPTINYGDERVFAERTTTADIQNLCRLLKKIQKIVKPDLQSILYGFLQRNDV